MTVNIESMVVAVGGVLVLGIVAFWPRDGGPGEGGAPGCSDARGGAREASFNTGFGS